MNITKITATENGPLKIEGLKQITKHSGETLSEEREVYLCRCSGSMTKPFCNGNHMKNGFSGATNPHYIRNHVDVYKGKEITVYDNRSVCSHRGYCTNELSTVFKEETPWIDPDGDRVEKIIALCNKCPSGALSYALTGEERVQGDYEELAIIKIAERHYGYHGPYDFKGRIILEGQTLSKSESPMKVTLCRCGHSKNKPFCSGEHFYIKFIDESTE